MNNVMRIDFEGENVGRAIIFWEDFAWIAFLIDVDIVAQGNTKEEAIKRLYICFCIEKQFRSGDLNEIPPAPDVFRKVWEETFDIIKYDISSGSIVEE